MIKLNSFCVVFLRNKSEFKMRIVLLTWLLITTVLAGNSYTKRRDFRLQTVTRPVNEDAQSVTSRSRTNIHYTQNLNESSVSFNGDSFVAFTTDNSPTGVNQFDFRFNVRPRNSQDSILLYMAEKYFSLGDFAALIIKNGHYEFRFKSGIFTDTICSEKGVDVNKWTSISFGYDMGVGFLKVGDSPQITRRTTNIRRKMLLNTNLYIGGYDSSHQLNRELEVNKGFDGCISDLEILSKRFDMHSAINGANIQYCENTTTEVASVQHHRSPAVDTPSYSGHSSSEVVNTSANNPCENNGIWATNGNTKICRCPIHFAGEYCQHSVPITYASQYKGSGYIELNKSTVEGTFTEKYISFRVLFSTMEPNGLLIWYGQPNGVAHNEKDFIALAVVGGFLKTTFCFGGNERVFTTIFRVDNGQRHSVVLYQNDNKASVIIDNTWLFKAILQPMRNHINLTGNIFIGGTQNMGAFTGNRYLHGFKGCIAVYVQNVPVNMYHNAVSGYDVIRCSESCLNNLSNCDIEVETITRPPSPVVCPSGSYGIYRNCSQALPPTTTTTTTTPAFDTPTTITPSPCFEYEWQCDNGKCINAEFLCDGLLDCLDNSDETEKNCPLKNVNCNKNQIACDDKCHPRSIICNGVPECTDGSDETNCPI